MEARVCHVWAEVKVKEAERERMRRRRGVQEEEDMMESGMLVGGT
jgi:hypothetical protein